MPIRKRSLPEVRNELMLQETDPAVLSSKCRVQDVRFGTADQEGTSETFVRIKTTHPKTTNPHFIMRKAKDDYISATSMFRSVYYDADPAEEKLEMSVVKRELAARSDENASGVWIPGVPDALELADIYGIRPWVQALLDAPKDKSAYASDDLMRSPTSASPTKDALPVPETPSWKPTSRARSASPRKTIAASARKTKKTIKSAIDSIAEDAGDAVEKVKDEVVPEAKVKFDDLTETLEKPVSAPKVVSKAVGAAKKAVVKGEEAVTNGIDEAEKLFSATVENVGQSMSEMVAEARAQVEAAERNDAASLTESGLKPTPAKRGRPPKRQAKDIAVDDAEKSDDADVKEDSISIKRTKVEDLEVDLVQEKRKVRALFGLALGLGATAILPYLI